MVNEAVQLHHVSDAELSAQGILQQVFVVPRQSLAGAITHRVEFVRLPRQVEVLLHGHLNMEEGCNR